MILFTTTQSEYKKRVRSLINRYQGATGQVVETKDDLPAFADWCINILRPTLGPSTWRSYRYQLQQCIDDNDFVETVSVKPANKKRDMVTKNTSSNRSKRLPENELDLFARYCRQSHSQYAKPLFKMLSLGIKLGIRPSEWASTKLIANESPPYISVESVIKGHKDLPSLSTRRVPVDHLSLEEQSDLDDFLERVALINDFGSFLTGVKMFMLNASKTLYAYGEKRPSLYSARHQFAANLKASGISKEVIAAVMGHADTDMQTKYYGRKSHGNQLAFNEAAAARLNNV